MSRQFDGDRFPHFDHDERIRPFLYAPYYGYGYDPYNPWFDQYCSPYSPYYNPLYC